MREDLNELLDLNVKRKSLEAQVLHVTDALIFALTNKSCIVPLSQ